MGYILNELKIKLPVNFLICQKYGNELFRGNAELTKFNKTIYYLNFKMKLNTIELNISNIIILDFR